MYNYESVESPTLTNQQVGLVRLLGGHLQTGLNGV